MDITPDNWNRAKELFEAALEMEPPQQASFLAEKCEDENLRQQVERLLVNFQEAGSFLDDPVLGPKIDTPDAPAKDPVPEFTQRAPESSSPSATATSAEAEDPMIGRQLGAYKLVRRVGQGGMADVYQAVRVDGEFHKQVAIKLVQCGRDSEEVLKRFRNERQTLASLDHPNIVKLLDGSTTPEGAPYLIMDYVEGSPIDEYCGNHKLPIEDRLRLLGKVCEAVEYAHQRRVIHRDLKPTNILVTAEGVPKLLDFGIAKVLEARAGTLTVTHTGTRCMTPAYASPEQVRGRAVTPATDIYSLGVVLYELLSRHRPYRLKEGTAGEMERAICEQEPEPPSTAASRVERHPALAPSLDKVGVKSDGKVDLASRSAVLPSGLKHDPKMQENLRRRLRGDLDHVVLKALRKEPERRYHSAQELARDIERHLDHLPVSARPASLGYRASKFIQRRWVEVGAALIVAMLLIVVGWLGFRGSSLRDRIQGGASTPRIQSLAVLPLANLSGDPVQEYFSDGMTDTLITNLAQIGSLKVISHTSTMQYKQTKKSLPEIARELNVDGIIEGSVQRSGNRVLITAQLVQGPTDKHLWANSYERDMQDVFLLERDVAGDIAQQIRARVTAPGQAAPAQPRAIKPEALEAYLQGNYYLNRGSGDPDVKKAQKFFQQAVDADPAFVRAYVGLALSHYWLIGASAEDRRVRQAAAEKAVTLDTTSPDAHSMLGLIRFSDWEFSRAEAEWRRAIALDPNGLQGHDGLCSVLNIMLRLEESLPECNIAQMLDPDNDHLSQTFEARRQYDQAIESLERQTRHHPDDGFLHYYLFRDYLLIGMYQKSIDELERSLTLLGRADAAAAVRSSYATSGYQGALRTLAGIFEQSHKAGQLFLPRLVAEVYAQLGDKDRAFYWLEQGYVHHDRIGIYGGLEWITIEHVFDPLVSDRRYKDLLDRIGLPEEEPGHSSKSAASHEIGAIPLQQ